MWTYVQPVITVFSEQASQNIAKIMAQQGLKDALLIADAFLLKNGTADKIKAASDGRILDVIGDVDPNPTFDNVDHCLEKAKQIGAKCIVALGGGSSIDTGKSVCVALANQCKAADLGKLNAVKTTPLIAMPTTAGTGSEVTAGAVLSDPITGQKSVLSGIGYLAKMAIIDPMLTYSCPPSVTARTGMDVIAHCLDVLGNEEATPVSDVFAVKAAKLAFANIEQAYRNGSDVTARHNMSEASLLAGYAFGLVGTTGSHACSYEITTRFHVPHGEACAFTLDQWFAQNARIRPRLKKYAKEMGFESVEAVCEKIRQLKHDFGFKTTLEELGATDADVDAFVASAMDSSNMRNNIAKLTAAQVKELFYNAK